MSATGRQVVVGFDGSPGSRAALKWARKQANWQLSDLLVVRVIGAAERRTGRLLELSDPEVVTDVGDPVEVLLDRSMQASMLCIGAGGRGMGYALGPTATALARHAACTVAVIRPDIDDADGVISVVLNDESDNDVVVCQAMHQGRIRGMTVRQIDRRIDSWIRRFPDVPVELVSADRGVAKHHGEVRPTRLAVVSGRHLDLGESGHPAGSLIHGCPYRCSMLVVRADGEPCYGDGDR